MSDVDIRDAWKESRLKVIDQWGRLTEHDLDQIGLERDLLVRIVQKKYGYTRERAELEVDHFLQSIIPDDSIPLTAEGVSV
jgi:uncharacterized protein YjbJ (UPF0337 family)